MGRLYKEFQSANCEILLILGEPVEKAVRYAETLHLPFPVLADAQRSAYHRYGLEKVMAFLQRTASIVIDRAGVIRYMKIKANPMPWLVESQEVLGFVKILAGEGPGTGI